MSDAPSEHQFKILVICEGDEEIMYLQALIDLNVFDPMYEVIPKLAALAPGDSGGAGKVPMVFQYYYTSQAYDAMYFMIDVDANPHEAFENVKTKVNGIAPKLFEKHALYTNPCTLQLMVLHFEKTVLSNQNKANNTAVVKRIWPSIKKQYSAKAYQLNIMKYAFSANNYMEMKQNMKTLESGDCYSAPSSNIPDFFDHLESGDASWLTKKSK